MGFFQSGDLRKNFIKKVYYILSFIMLITFIFVLMSFFIPEFALFQRSNP